MAPTASTSGSPRPIGGESALDQRPSMRPIPELPIEFSRNAAFRIGARPSGIISLARSTCLDRPALRFFSEELTRYGDHMAKYANILETVGRTPIVKIGRL